MNYKQLFDAEGHNCVNKWSHYFDIYDDVFSWFQGTNDVRVLEIGVQNGGSLQVLSQYFGKESQISGLDVDARCSNLKLGNNISVTIGNASDPKVCDSLGVFDLIIDDGSHSPKDQRTTLNNLFMKHLSEGGVYLIEDLEHSFQDWWKTTPSTGKQEGSLKEAISDNKNFVQDIQDMIYEIQHKQIKPSSNEIMENTWKITNYSGIVCLYKRKPQKREILWSKGPRPIA